MEEQNKNTGVSTGNSSPHYIATSESQVVEQETIDYIAGCKDLMNERICTIMRLIYKMQPDKKTTS